MKKLLYIITLLTFVLWNTSYASAQTVTPKQNATPTISETVNEKLNSQINQLKDKIASRVSELNLVEKKGVTGVSTSKITLKDLSGNTKLIDIDEITKFSSSSARGTFGLSDLTKGTKINVLGLYNKQSKRILARFISTAVNPVFLSGTISEIDSKNFTANIISTDLKNTKIDVGTTTKISLHNTEDGLTRIGFTRLVAGNMVTAVGFPDKNDPSLIVASRIVVLPDLPKDPKVSIIPPTPTATPTTTQRRVTQTPATRIATPTVSR
jgi:hypothetical protein